MFLLLLQNGITSNKNILAAPGRLSLSQCTHIADCIHDIGVHWGTSPEVPTSAIIAALLGYYVVVDSSEHGQPGVGIPRHLPVASTEMSPMMFGE